MEYTAIQIADYTVSRCIINQTPISNLHLNKILYFMQRDFLQNTPSELFADDFEAWKFGPVVPSVYYKYCSSGGAKILFNPKVYLEDLEQEKRKKIDLIIDERIKINPWSLVDETHAVNGAWDLVFAKGKGNHVIIPKELIKVRG